MGELVLLVVAAAWAAVLIPPLVRSRIENRPNSSVTDFRRQLNRLQSTVPSRASGPMRGMARPLAPSPLQRPAAGGRPGMQAAQLRRTSGGTRAHGARAASAALAPVREAAPRRRTHGDPTGGQPRPRQMGHRQAHVSRHAMAAAEVVRRRRSNMLFMLVLAAGSTLFLAATTKEPIMGYLFAAAFLTLCGYLYLLSQARQREATAWPQDWMQR
ncbi:MAG TPA: hypothetical protein VE487_11140 [Ilumatobacter sp.]|jgi:hypothetical protein|nr:hypothetical protein [Ilumatobacter sp.]